MIKWVKNFDLKRNIVYHKSDKSCSSLIRIYIWRDISNVCWAYWSFAVNKKLHLDPQVQAVLSLVWCQEILCLLPSILENCSYTFMRYIGFVSQCCPHSSGIAFMKLSSEYNHLKQALYNWELMFLAAQNEEMHLKQEKSSSVHKSRCMVTRNVRFSQKFPLCTKVGARRTVIL